MQSRWEYQLPTKIQFGPGELRKLGETARQFGRSALLVGYRDRKGLEETYDRAARSLVDAGLAVTKFYEISPDPDGEPAVEGGRRVAESGADVVVGPEGGYPVESRCPATPPEDPAGKLARNAVESTLKPLEWTPQEIDEPAQKGLFGEILETG
jgi:hypothetical protein